MSKLIWQNRWFIWAVILTIVYPTLIIVLGEIAHRLQRRSEPLAAILRFVRNSILPLLILILFLLNVLEVDPNGNLIKIIETILSIIIIYASLSLFNVVFFTQARSDTWRAKVPKLFVETLRLFLIVLGIAIVMASVWGADIAGFFTALGVGSVVLGLALQDTLGSVISGIALIFSRHFSVGDWLKIGDFVGKVIEIDWRGVRLLSRERYVIIMPHTFVASEVILNYTQPTKIHVETFEIDFSIDDPPNLVKQVVKSTALATEGVLAYPEPEIQIISDADYKNVYEVRFCVENFRDAPKIRDRLIANIWYAAARNNLQETIPVYKNRPMDNDPNSKETTSRQFVESLQSIPLFMPLAKKQGNLERLSNSLELLHFGMGEKIIREGDVINVLYVIIAGQAAIAVKNAYGKEEKIMTLARGDFFGEMALFSGKPSNISVTASEDLQVIIMSSDAVNKMIETQSNLGREIGQMISARRKQINRVKQQDVSSKSLSVRDLLKRVTYFENFTELQLDRLIEIGYRQRLNESEILCNEGDPGNAFYIILSGSVEVFAPKLEKHLATIYAGSFLGELALILGIPRTASVRAIVPTVLFAINREGFQDLLRENSELAEIIIEELVKHQAELAQRQQELREMGLLSKDEDDPNLESWARKRIGKLFLNS